MAEIAERIGAGFPGAEEAEAGLPEGAEIVCTSRDDRDVSTIRVVGLSLLVSLVGNALLAVAVVALLFSKPYMQFIRTSPDGEVLSVDVRRLGEAEPPGFVPDEYARKMKLTIARDFAKAKYTVNKKTREEDMANFLRMMVKGTAEEYWADHKRKQIPQIEEAEQRQATWVEQDVQMDEEQDPYLIRIIGQQKMVRVVDEVTKEETYQFTLEVRLTEDTKGPLPRNHNTGYRVATFSEKQL